MTIQSPIIILDNHFNGSNTLIYNEWVMCDCIFFDSSDDEQVAHFLGQSEIPDELWQQVLDVMDSGEGTEVEDEDYSSELAEFAFSYCYQVSLDDDMRQVIVDAKDPESAYNHCLFLTNDDDMRQIILDAKKPKWACYYCRDISNDADMRQVILDARDAGWAYMYCRHVKNTNQMRQIIVDVADPEWAHLYWLYIDEDDKDMRQIASLLIG